MLLRVLASTILVLLVLSACSPDLPNSEPARLAIGGLAGELGLREGETFEEGGLQALANLSNEEQQRCMLRQGFEWTPPPVPSSITSSADDPDSLLSPAEYAQTLGFGITAMRTTEIDLGDPTLSNPNNEYLSGLTESEREAWSVASSDCLNIAYEAQDQFILNLDPLVEAHSLATERLEADPRVVEHGARWPECMAQAGYPGLLNQDLLIGDLIEEGLAITDDEELVRFTDREIAIATASFTCRQALEEVRSAVRIEIEDELLANDPIVRQAAEEFREASGR